MTYKIRTLRVAALVVALVALSAFHTDAQTGKTDGDLQRAQAIVNELVAGTTDKDTRDTLGVELDCIGAHEYVVSVNLTARQCDLGGGYFPVTRRARG
jgi:hypothetical protein